MTESYRWANPEKTVLYADYGDGRNATVPIESSEYQRLEELEVTIDDYVEPPPEIPAVVTPLQARKALSAAGLRDDVETWVSEQPLDIKDAWEYATAIYRDDPVITQAAAALGMTPQQVDALFVAASQM